jgi:hypothetical protein
MLEAVAAAAEKHEGVARRDFHRDAGAEGEPAEGRHIPGFDGAEVEGGSAF